MAIRIQNDQVPALSALVALTAVDLTGALTGVLDGTLSNCTATNAGDVSAIINKNFAELQAQLAALVVDLAATHADLSAAHILIEKLRVASAARGDLSVS